ncbi:uncharacterized protein LOC111093101 isoform X2 [Canis lupus familiaris]|uniref:uncharacterized protein LOC111093101 isoform X2 n=1 Tax=Canis lupus familiaris TaxID=9615 RepID=UPI00005A50BC|nr:uncharacterized protein LOC111093101 isoform X2 [Canis lupus familiaris]XP_038316922.1 uncharacterized protein LOC111093101 isoform X2 [Canis lupus familiaris]XP_038435528.1 uncharacterized protein LOC111093101 isoform X2 [Canis lupus familiaris]
MLEMQQWKFYAGMKTTGKLLEREGVWRGWWSVRSQTGGLLAAFSEGTRLLLASPSSQWSRCPESTNRSTLQLMWSMEILQGHEKKQHLVHTSPWKFAP